ncbi:hypothetical protein KFK09_025165 [Dendrobium nobile]|uniref:Uncharacterized protein n=1 Tax=Dendrobium nobile TaxID=94219 RepID=A0A8T3AFV8_DENNO|nr:hypothetical protein KFK09_025165 [Dendrobium nobile]
MFEVKGIFDLRMHVGGEKYLIMSSPHLLFRKKSNICTSLRPSNKLEVFVSLYIISQPQLRKHGLDLESIGACTVVRSRNHNCKQNLKMSAKKAKLRNLTYV